MFKTSFVNTLLCIFCFSIIPTSLADTSAQVPNQEMLSLAKEYNRSVGGQTLVVMHQGKVILEDYANGGKKERFMMLASGSKSFNGIVALAAIEDGIITLDEKVCDSLTEWKEDPLKSLITYRHLLTLTSGLDPGPTDGKSKKLTWDQIIHSPMTGAPGKQFVYGSTHFNTFGEALQRYTKQLFGETYEQYLKRRILDPIGVRVFWGMRCKDGNPQLAGGAYMKAMDWAKFGEWVRSNGVWNKKQIIQADLFSMLTQGSDQNPAYGLTWWLKEPVSAEQIRKIPILQSDMGYIANSDWVPEDLFMAAGAGKQLLYIIPSLELVIVRQAPLGNEKKYRDMEFLSILLRGKKNGDQNTKEVKLNFSAASKYSKDNNGLGVLINQNNKILFEEYQAEYNQNTFSHIHSATKGFWGPVVAAMIEDGMIQSFDQKVSDILIEWKTTNKKDITIRQVMQLTSGLKNDVDNLQGEDPAAPDLFEYVINNVTLATKPGTHFQYGPVNFYVMGALMDRVLKNKENSFLDPLDYLQKRLLDKIGVTYEKWTRDEAGNPHIPNGAYITPRNFAIWGQFILQEGKWNGVQLVRKDLMEELSRPSPLNPGYGLFLWLNNPGGQGAYPIMKAPLNSTAGFIYYNGYSDLVGLLGAGKNRMYLIPSLDMVIVRQTLNETDDFDDHTFLSLLFSESGSEKPDSESFSYAMQDEVWRDETRDRDIPVRIYAPDLKHGPGPFPTIVFSHGGGESREAFTFLGTYWAENGYNVVFLTHFGSDRSVIDEQLNQGVTGLLALMAALDGPEKFHLRPEDVSFVINKIVSGDHHNQLLKERVDCNRIGMAGQCAGSSTALAMVGLNINLPDKKNATFTDQRIKVALALSPQMAGKNANSPLHQNSWKDIQVPTLVMTGTKDFNWIPAVKSNPRLLQMAYDGLPPGNKYLVEIKDAEHNAFTDSVPYYPARERDPRHHLWIQQASTAFFNAYLKDDTKALDWLQKETLEKETEGECRQEQKHITSTKYSIGIVQNLILHNKNRDEDLELRITYPKEEGKFPLILFSHCIGGKKEDFALLVQYWAANGYIVLQMDSTDSDSMELSWRNRALDISFVLDSVDEIEQKVQAINGKMDKKSIGVGGHLVGAYASSMLVGMKRYEVDGSEKKDTFIDSRVDATLQLSPQGRGQGLTENSWKEIVKPMLVAAGSETPSRRTSNPSNWRTEPYEFSKPGHKYLLWIEKMDNSYAGLSLMRSFA
jgi:CubicO group peptidase (beta-lactamase class C family)/predicted dienelactone hydrolase